MHNGCLLACSVSPSSTKLEASAGGLHAVNNGMK